MERWLLLLSLLSESLIGFTQQPKLVLPLGHINGVSSAKFSSDGKYITTVGAFADNTVRIWESASGKLLRSIVCSDMVNSAILSPDGKHIITTFSALSLDGTAIIWEVASGRKLFSLYGATENILSAEYSPDGRHILTASYDKMIRIWNAATGKLLRNLKHPYEISSAQYSPDGKYIITLSDINVKNIATIRDAASGKLLHEITGVTSFDFGIDENKILILAENGIIKVLETVSGKLLSSISEHREYSSFTYAQFSSDGSRIISVSKDKTAKIWDTISGKLLFLLMKDYLVGNNESVESAQFSPDGRYIVTVSELKIKIWNALSGILLHSVQGHTNSISSVQYSQDSKYFVTASYDNTVKIWEVNSAILLHSLGGHSFLVSSVQYSPDGKYIVTTSSYDNTAKIWEANSGKLLHSLKGHTERVSSAQYNFDGKYIVTASWDNTAKVWAASSGKLLKTLEGHKKRVLSAQYSPDSKYIVTSSFDRTVQIWEASSGILLYNLKGPNVYLGDACKVQFSPDGHTIITTSSADSIASIWQVSTGTLLYSLKGHSKGVSSAQFSLDGKYIVTTGDKTAKVWETSTGKLLHNFQEKVNDIVSAAFSPDGKFVATASYYENSIKIWDITSGKKVKNWEEPDVVRINSIQYSREGNYIIAASYFDNTVKVLNTQSEKLERTIQLGLNTIEENIDITHDKLFAVNDSETKVFRLSTGKLLYSFIGIDSTDHISLLSSRYYMATQNAAKQLHYVTKDLKVITFEQLDVKYNRPDKVLEAIGNTDTALIKSYRKAWEKRIKKLGIDTTAFRDGYSVPDADFVNRDSIEYEQKTGTLRLHIKGMDSTYKLERFNIWVNESPVFGQRGISLRTKNSHSFDTTVSIPLSQGKNRIETSITNVNGTESYRMPLQVNYSPAVKQKDTIRFIGIGIQRFADNTHPLNYSVKDIRDLALKFKEKYKDNLIIDTLFNENVTFENVKALKQKLLTTSVNDKVIISYSGHGLLSESLDYYLSTYNINFQKPEENGLPYDELENLLDSIPARKKLLLIDACHSGEVDKEEQLVMDKKALDLGLGKGADPESNNNNLYLGLKNSFELMQSLFVNVGKSTGATVIAAAAGNQYALEGVDKQPNGIFTYCLLEALNKNETITINELKKQVGQRVEEITGGLQKPTSRKENNTTNWSVW